MLRLPLSLRVIYGKNGNNIYLPLKWGKRNLKLSLTNVWFITLHTHTHTPDWGFVVSALHSKFKEGMAASLVAQIVKNLSAMRETQVQSLTWEDPLEKEMAIHSSILAWEIPWTEEPGELQVMELQS